MSSCLLLDRLPFELREAIYIETLQSSGPIVIKPTENGLQAEHKEERFTVPPLLSTCHQIRNEARKIFYEVNTFRPVMSETVQNGLLTPMNWLSPLPTIDRKSIKNITINFKYAGFEGSMRSWSNTLDEMVASGQDPMTAFAHLPGHLYRKRHDELLDVLTRLKAIENINHALVNFEIEEFDGDMFPHVWKQCWVDCLNETGGVFGDMTVKKVKGKETRPPGCTCFQ